MPVCIQLSANWNYEFYGKAVTLCMNVIVVAHHELKVRKKVYVYNPSCIQYIFLANHTHNKKNISMEMSAKSIIYSNKSD